MAIKNDTPTERQSSRAKSLRYHSDQEKPEIPAYLKAVSASEEEQALGANSTPAASLTSLTDVSSTRKTGVITITMDRTSIFSIIFGVILSGICFFIIGFLTANFYFNAPSNTKTAAALEQKAPLKIIAPETPEQAASDEDENARLAKIAEGITGKLDETKEAATGAAKKKADELAAVKESIESAKQKAEETLKVIPSLYGNPKALSTGNFYSIELSETDSRDLAKSMQDELKKVNLETMIVESPNDEGLPHYLIQLGSFEEYDLAQQALNNLPKPYSLWGKIVKNQKNPGKNQARG